MELTKRGILHSRIRLSSLMLFCVTMPFSLISLNGVAIMLFGLNWLFESSFTVKWERLKRNPLAILFIQLYLVYVFGLLYSENTHEGLFELEKKLSVLLFPLILGTSEPISKLHVRKILISFVFACFAAALTCYAYAVYLNYKEGYTLSYVFNAVFHNIHVSGKYNYLNYWYFTYELFAMPIHMHPIYLAMYTVFSCCISVWLWWDQLKANGKKKLAFTAFMLFNFITVVLLSSRTQLLIMGLFGTGFIMYQAHAKRKLLVGIAIILAVAGLGLVFIFSNPMSRERFIESNKPGAHFSTNKFGEGGLSLRTYKWLYTLETIRQHPVLGTGTGDSQDRLQETYKKHDFKIGYELRFNAHNQFLQMLLELGIIGLCSFSLCLVAPLYQAIKQKQFIYVAFLVVFTISCLTESMLEVNKGIVFYAFFNALFAKVLLTQKEDA